MADKNKSTTSIEIYIEDKKLLDTLAKFRTESYKDILHRVIVNATKKRKK